MPNKNKKRHSQEEINVMRKTMLEFYEKELPFLRLQNEYELLQASIEESRLRKTIAIHKQIQIKFQVKESKEEYLKQQEVGKNPDTEPLSTIKKTDDE